MRARVSAFSLPCERGSNSHTATRPSAQGPASAFRFNYYSNDITTLPALGAIHKVRDFEFGDFCVDSRWDLGIAPTSMAGWVAPWLTLVSKTKIAFL